MSLRALGDGGPAWGTNEDIPFVLSLGSTFIDFLPGKYKTQDVTFHIRVV